MAYLDETRAASITNINEQLAGAAGIPTFPAAAVPANNVSVAEVLRSVWAALEGTATGENGITTWPAAAAPGNAVSIAEAIAWINDALQGANGVVTFPAAAAPANGVSLAEVISAIYGLSAPAVATGTADIDDSVQDESAGWVALLTIEPAAGAPLAEVVVCLDLDKATTGFGAVETSATIQFRIARKIDGTLWRGAQTGSPADQLSAAISGSNAAAGDAMVELRVGSVGVTEDVRIELKMSADATADMEIPYAVMYRGIAAPTITPVAAG